MPGPSIDQLFAQTGVIKKQPKAATSVPPTFNPSNPSQVLTAPAYREHLTSLTDSRLSMTSQDLLKAMFKSDPDASAAVGAFLTLADTQMTCVVRDAEGQIDPTASAQLPALIRALTFPTNYLNGFQLKPSIGLLCQEMRYMVMLRGAIGNELVFDAKLVPNRLQHVDMSSVTWVEAEAGSPKPQQTVAGRSAPVSLDVPSFFVAYHRRDPTTLYATSDFVSVINTAAARTQIINDLYRIMSLTGFPRMDIKVLEETLLANMPEAVKADTPQAQAAWVQARLNEVSSAFADLRSDQNFAHLDSVEVSMLNEKNPGAAIDITNVIEVLNAQNQAALKTMATVIGRGSGAAGVASVEARIAAMNADQLNVPVKAQLDQVLTFLLNCYGIQGFVDCAFAPAELRPSLELEAQRSLKASRLLMDLSLGLISDEEYSMAMYSRLPGPDAPVLSGTGFMSKTIDDALLDPSGVASGSDPLGKSLTGEGAAAANGNGKVASKKPAKTKAKGPPPARAAALLGMLLREQLEG